MTGISRYQELQQVAGDAAAHAHYRQEATAKFVGEALARFQVYLDAPRDAVVLLPWSNIVVGFEGYSPNRQVPLADTLHYDAPQDRWEFPSMWL